VPARGALAGGADIARPQNREENAMSIQWGRVFLGAFLLELVLIAIAVPVTQLGAGWSLVYIVPPLSFIVTFGITVWLGRKIASRLVLHGVLIGIAASIMYVVLTRGQPEPWPYLLAHALKIIGGAAGGLVLAQRRPTTSLSSTAAY
jgi:uncharacterized PurR-regulated membrane protein YhhQ (DUF165 family)